MFPPPRLDQLPGVRHKPRLMCISLAALNLVPGGICTDTPREKKKTKRQNFRISVKTAGGWGWGAAGYDWLHTRMESVSKFWKSLVPAKLRAYLKDYCKRNGLLTLSVIAVVTGCVLGFLLRTFNLSTQVRLTQQHSCLLFQSLSDRIWIVSWSYRESGDIKKQRICRNAGMPAAPFLFPSIASLSLIIKQPFHENVCDKIGTLLCGSDHN